MKVIKRYQQFPLKQKIDASISISETEKVAQPRMNYEKMSIAIQALESYSLGN